MLSNKETRLKKISNVDAQLFDFLSLQRVQIKENNPRSPEETRIVKKLELKVAPE